MFFFSSIQFRFKGEEGRELSLMDTGIYPGKYNRRGEELEVMWKGVIIITNCYLICVVRKVKT